MEGKAAQIIFRWAQAGDTPVPADYDGDGATDLAIWRPGSGEWWILKSSEHFGGWSVFQWGAGALGDVPAPADYDGDGRADVAIWRSSTGQWYILRSATNDTAFWTVQWGDGASGDIPLTGDYDGDDRADLTIWRPASGIWYESTTAYADLVCDPVGRAGLRRRTTAMIAGNQGGRMLWAGHSCCLSPSARRGEQSRVGVNVG